MITSKKLLNRQINLSLIDIQPAETLAELTPQAQSPSTLNLTLHSTNMSVLSFLTSDFQSTGSVIVFGPQPEHTQSYTDPTIEDT